MRSEEFILSSKGLSNTNVMESEPFWFVVGGREFKCSKFQALFVSKAVERVMRSDNTVNRFEVEVNESSFGDICCLMEGKSIVLSADNIG
jgi:hypothetical protein